MKHKPLAALRDALVSRVRDQSVRDFLGGQHERHCVTCGARFDAAQRWNFFCQSECRDAWYRGQFRPRPRD